MTCFLLDVNVLIALIERDHVHHEAAQRWFAATGAESWATCPLTQNGVMRIVGHSTYPGDMGPPAAIAVLLQIFCALPGHQFWPDAISLIDPRYCDASRLLTSAQLTDTYLLALAGYKGGKFATFDRRIVADAAVDGRQHLEVLS